MKLDLLSSHYNAKNWLDPYDFEPERHDIESEFYQKSKEAGKMPDVYSRRTFSHGTRSCPGMSFATLEMKIMIAYLVTHLEYEFEEGILEHEGIGFGIGSQFEPKIRVTKIH